MSRPVRLLIAALVAAAPGLVRAVSPGEPVSVVEQMETALNSGNVDAFVAWFAPKGVIKERGGKVYATKDAVREWAQAVVAHNYRATPGKRERTGDRVTWDARVEFDDLRALGVQSVDSHGEATVQGGMIVSFTPAFSPGSIVLLGTASAHLLEDRYRLFVDAAYNQGRADAMQEYCSPQLVDHNPLPGGFPSVEGLQAGIAALRAAFPDLKAVIEDVIPAGDRVAARVSFTGTHKAAYQGAPATFRQVAFSLVDIYRVEDGKLIEHWGLLDLASLNRQLGVSGAPATGGAAPAPAPAQKKGGHGGILGGIL